MVNPVLVRYLIQRMADIWSGKKIIFSPSWVWPLSDDPQLIVYVGVQQPELEPTEIGSDPVSAVFNPVMQNSLKYLNIKPQEKVSLKKQSLPDTREMSVEEAKTELEKAGVDSDRGRKWFSSGQTASSRWKSHS